MPATVKFYSAWYCPFAQRTWSALEYLGVPYTYEETDPYIKTNRWLAVSRGTGQVPVLQIKNQDQTDIRIPDSLRTLEYLDEAPRPHGALFPTNFIDRAEARYWLDHQGKEIIPNFYRYLNTKGDIKTTEAAKVTMIAGIKALTKAMSTSGPYYFFGDQTGVVDLAFAPFAYRIELLLSHYKCFHLSSLGDDWPRFETWLKAIKSHPAFISTMPNPDTYDARLIEFYLPYSTGGGQQDVTIAA